MLAIIGVHQAMESSSASAFVSASGQLADGPRYRETVKVHAAAGIDAASRRPAEDLSKPAQDIGWTSSVGYLVRWPPQARGARSTKRGSVTEPPALLVPSRGADRARARDVDRAASFESSK